VVAAAQSGPHNGKRISYGHSMIVNPWDEVIARLGGDYTEPEIATAEIDLDFITRIRTQMPLLRRTDVYPEV
jgi:deaminated glutathione amidase